MDRSALIERSASLSDRAWTSGIGDFVSIPEGKKIVVARICDDRRAVDEADLLVLDDKGKQVGSSGGEAQALCCPLLLPRLHARGAGLVIHHHSVASVLAGVCAEEQFSITHIERMTGIRGVSYADELIVPVVDHVDDETALCAAVDAAIETHPGAYAVLLRRHGVYVWGADGDEAERHAACYEYLFRVAQGLLSAGIDPKSPPRRRAPIRGFV